MPDLLDGESVEVQGSARSPYILKNVGGVYSCSCPAWRNQSLPIERRSCKHLRSLRGETAEAIRRHQTLPAVAPAVTKAVQPPPLLLAHSWENAADITGWWLSEKLDGVRAYWTGADGKFLSRQGNLFHAPPWFTANLPSVTLDGELWIDRKAFQRTVSIVRRQDQSDLWREVRFVVFDAPAAKGGFEARQEFLETTLVEHRPQFARVLHQERCRGLQHLREELLRITSVGGEGLMLRQPGSRYEVGRSNTLLKAKSFAELDAEVVEHLAGQGRHRGRMGALLVQLANGLRFNVGTGFTDAQRESPPKIGSIVTVRYQELTDRGVPRFPSFVRVRRDVTSLTTE
jgi:DNA ligase-1